MYPTYHRTNPIHDSLVQRRWVPSSSQQLLHNVLGGGLREASSLMHCYLATPSQGTDLKRCTLADLQAFFHIPCHTVQTFYFRLQFNAVHLLNKRSELATKKRAGQSVQV
uniref:Uncharacterized protein n=1 Tax=Dunaliella tertiolecta TaxID=3047 RepID=A0A7S3QSL1_DUNTE|eukprot:1158883-Pelagomonas_calceolata.AAC.1